MYKRQVADAEGRFELVLPVSIQYVVVSFIGYEALRADISGETVFTFRLKEDLKQLEEVVVTGYQKIEKHYLPWHSSIKKKDASRFRKTSTNIYIISITLSKPSTILHSPRIPAGKNPPVLPVNRSVPLSPVR